MTMLNIGGKQVKVDDSFLKLSPEEQNKAVDEIAQSLGIGGQQADPYAARAQAEAAKLAPVTSGALQASSAGLSSGLMGNFEDELGAVMTAPFRMAKDRVGPVEAYKREQALNQAIKQQQRAEHPIANTLGQVAGGLALAGKAGQAGLTTAGRTGASTLGRAAGGALEGGGYGAFYGAGDPGKESRLRGAAEGAAIGGITGGILGGASGALANRSARKAAEAAVPTLNDLKASEGQLFDAARNAGVMVKPQGMDKLANNMQMAAGRINQNLRPKTAGVLEDIMAMKGQAADVQTIHETRQLIQQAMSNADPQDVRSLSKMLKVLDNFIDNPNPASISGTPEGLKTLRTALDTSAKRFKVEAINKLMDFADVKTGQYTQSGMMNALRSEASKLYRQIVNGTAKGFSAEETAIIRGLAKTENTSAATKLLAKLAPRGPVAMIGSTILGGMAGGPLGAAVPAAAGAIAARSADRSAMAAAQALRNSAATGGAFSVLPQLPGRGANVLIGPATQQMVAVRP